MDLPFLYHTRTILRRGKVSSRWTRSLLQPRLTVRCLHQPPQVEQENPISFFREKAEAVAAKVRDPKSSTITPEEQRAFDQLRRLAGQNQRPSQYDGLAPETERLNVDPQRVLDLFTPSASSNNAHDPIVTRICQSHMSRIFDIFTEALSSKTTSSDIALWKALQQHVFPLLVLLKPKSQITPEERDEVEKLFPRAKLIAADVEGQRTAAQAPLALETNHGDAEADTKTTTPKIPPLPFLTRLYPASILLAFRLLAKHHPLSPLTHSLLPHIRSLGAFSYVLGANTHFYNTLLFLRWNVYSSLREICDLLSEMERGAVEFDRGTHGFLSEIAEERLRDLMQTVPPLEHGMGERETVARGRKWWMRAEQVRWWPEVVQWRGMIARRLEERGLGEVVREGPLSGAEAGWDAGSTTKGGEVWL